MPKYRLLALSAGIGREDINPHYCMTEKLGKGHDLNGYRHQTRDGNTYYALFPRLLQDDWLDAVHWTVQTDTTHHKFLIVHRKDQSNAYR